MDLTLLLLLLLLGCATGFAAGLLGIGGGVLLVPFLTMLLSAREFPAVHVVHIAIATSLAAILFTSISSLLAHHARGAVLWPVVKALVPGILVGSLAGAQIAGVLPTTVVAPIFAVFAVFSATQMLLKREQRPHRALPNAPGMFGVGSVIGVLSSLVGAGAGVISVPFLVWCNTAMRSAVATSAALAFPIAVAGAVGYIVAGARQGGLPAHSLGFIYLPALAIVATGSVLTAPIGVRVAQVMNPEPLKRIFAALLYLLAAYMLAKAFAHV